mmetsp:Transcript_24407/g.56243  ORF Transcript_24407/g.56243 Transcript_24407/m.56243 type:complete len:342 (-) Transcript_24407:35-1060(-)
MTIEARCQTPWPGEAYQQPIQKRPMRGGRRAHVQDSYGWKQAPQEHWNQWQGQAAQPGNQPYGQKLCDWPGTSCNSCCQHCAARVSNPARGGYTAEEWEAWLSTPEGLQSQRWWAEWIPTPQGEQWSANKRFEARLLVESMIQAWGIDALRAGQGVVEVGGDPGFVASELLNRGIPATLIDPAFGFSGKGGRYTQDLYFPWHQHAPFQSCARKPLTILREPFDDVFLQNAEHAETLQGASAIVSLYPDEVTNMVLNVSAENNLRTVVIPCNECAQFFPPHNPTYEGFVQQLLHNDYAHANVLSGKTAPLQRSALMGSPFCQVMLYRSTDAGQSQQQQLQYA